MSPRFTGRKTDPRRPAALPLHPARLPGLLGAHLAVDVEPAHREAQLQHARIRQRPVGRQNASAAGAAALAASGPPPEDPVTRGKGRHVVARTAVAAAALVGGLEVAAHYPELGWVGLVGLGLAYFAAPRKSRSRNR